MAFKPAEGGLLKKLKFGMFKERFKCCGGHNGVENSMYTTFNTSAVQYLEKADINLLCKLIKVTIIKLYSKILDFRQINQLVR